MSGRVPVVPGPDGAVRVPMPDCVACGYGNHNGVIRARRTVAGQQLVLCVDWQACCARFGEAAS